MLESSQYHLARSSEFQKSLEVVRQLPQQTAAEKAEKKEKARLLRMEALLRNARLARLLLEKVVDQPWLSENDCYELAGESGLIVHPQSTEEFIRTFTDIKDQVKTAFSGSMGIDLGRMIYWKILACQERKWEMKNPGKRGWQFAGRPQDQIKCGKTYPLAIILEVDNPEDYDLIDALGNTGGFYQRSGSVAGAIQIKDKAVIGPCYVFPLIVVRGYKNTDDWRLTEWLKDQRNKVLMHEKSHAENRVFQDAVRKAGKRQVWPETCDERYLEENARKLEREWSLDPGATRNSELWRETLAYTFSRAKDELLSSLHPSNHFDPSKKLEELLQRENIYDYFMHDLLITISSPIYQPLRNEYEQMLRDEVRSAKFIIESYFKLQLFERIKDFRWVLSQIPLSQWDNQLKFSLFVEEAKRLRLLYEDPITGHHNRRELIWQTIHGRPPE